MDVLGLKLYIRWSKHFINNPPTSQPQGSGLESFLTSPGCWWRWLPSDSWNQINRPVALSAECWCRGEKEGMWLNKNWGYEGEPLRKLCGRERLRGQNCIIQSRVWTVTAEYEVFVYLEEITESMGMICTHTVSEWKRDAEYKVQFLIRQNKEKGVKQQS